MLEKEMLIMSDTQEKVNITNDTDYTARVTRAGNFLSTIPAGKIGSTYVPIGVVVSLSFPRLGWKLTRACHHEHIEKYITHWLYRFPSKAPNGGLIRKYLINLGVTSQLEVPYAA